MAPRLLQACAGGPRLTFGAVARGRSSCRPRAASPHALACMSTTLCDFSRGFGGCDTLAPRRDARIADGLQKQCRRPQAVRLRLRFARWTADELTGLCPAPSQQRSWPRHRCGSSSPLRVQRSNAGSQATPAYASAPARHASPAHCSEQQQRGAQLTAMAAAVLTLLLVTMPELGHLNPMITLGTALQQQQPGARVQLATLEHRRELVELAGLEFVGLGEWSEAEQENRTLNMRHAMSTKAGTPLTRMKAGAAMLCEMYAAKVSVPLVAHLAAANASNSLPDVIVADGLTAGACDAAEAFRLPLSVVWLHPTSMALQLSGYNHLNLPASVPFESLVHSVPEDASALVRYVLNPVLKRAFDALIKWLMPAPRNRARAQVGLPPLVAPAARRPHDCSATDAADGTLAPFAVQPAVPRAQFLLGITTDLNAPRALPPCWHVVGPVNIDWRSFPPKLEDEAVAAFLQQGQEAGEPVVLVAQGSMIELSQEQLSAMVDAFTQLTRPDEGHKPARILWALRSSLQASLPEDLRSCGSAGAAPSKNNSRIMVVPWLDQPAVLAHPDVHAFVSHGGLGSVHEALAAGKPVLVVPLTQSADHVIIGLQLHSRGLGEMLPASHLPRLAGAVRGLLQRGYEQRAAAVSAQWRQQGLGAQRAAAAVLDFARGGPARAWRRHEPPERGCTKS